MFLESNEENDRVECENESDLEDEDYVEFRSEDSDTEQDISSEKSEDELDVNESIFLERIKNKVEGKSNKTTNQKTFTEYFVSTPVSSGKPENAKTELETCNCFITNDTLDLTLLYTN